MAVDPRLPVRRGQRTPLSADQVNWINRQMGTAGPSGGRPIEMPQAPFTRMRCKNNSGSVVPRWGVIAITGLAIDSTKPQYQSEPVLAGTTPTATTESWVIAIEPIPAGKTGLVATPPLVQVKINVSDADHKWAKPGTTVTELVSTHIGSARIFARQSGTGAGKLAVVELGHRDLSLEEGYDEDADYQALYHRSGKLEWLHDFNCEELEGS